MPAQFIWVDKPENMSREEVEALLRQYDMEYDDLQPISWIWDDYETPELGIYHTEAGTEPQFIRRSRFEAMLFAASFIKRMKGE